MNVAILGAGSIGSLIAAKISNHGDGNLLVHARGEHGSVIALNGIKIQGEEELSVSNDRMIVSLDEVGLYQGLDGKIDYLLITSKANDVERMINKSRDLLHADSKVLCLSNGLGHVEKCIEFFGPQRVFSASISHGAWRPEPGIIEWAGKGVISIGKFSDGPGLNEAEELIQLLSNCDLNPQWVEDGKSLIWSKVLLNIAINPIAALIGCKNGNLLQTELFELCSSVMVEGANVARQEGVKLPTNEELISKLFQVIEATSNNYCSMLQDIKKGRDTEIKFLNLAIVQRAERYGLSTPKNHLLSELIKSINLSNV